MMTADSLRQIFGCKTDTELGALFGKKGGAVSAWRVNGLPASIERRAQELMQERNIVSEQTTEYSGIDPLLVEAVNVMKTWSRGKLARHVAQLIEEEEEANKDKP